jgi:hypothetical protein
MTRRVALAAILLLAAGLRLTRLGLIEFKYDEATTARAALAIAREGDLPSVGMISSEGPRNPALMSYLLAPPFALSRDPRFAAAWLALLGVTAVGLTYWLGNRFFSWPVGALAASLFAASPWAVFQSRKLWTQNVPLVTLVFAAFVLILVVRRRSWALAPALAAVGVLVGLHLGGLAFFVVLAAVLVLFRDRVRPLPFLLGIALLLLVLSPYLVHDATHRWRNLRAFAALGGSKPSLNLHAPAMAARIASGYHLEDLAGTRHAEFLASVPNLRWLDQLEIALFWLGLAWSAWRVGREALTHQGSLSTDGQARAVLLCWFLVPVALLARRTPVQPHDFNLLYPVQHLIIALLLADLVVWGRSWASRGSRMTLTAIVTLLLVSLVVWQVYFQEALLTFVDQHDTPGGHGAPLEDTLAAARRAETLAAPDDAALIALLPGGAPRVHGPAAVLDVLLASDRRRLVDGREALVLPARPAAYLVHPETSAAPLLGVLATESQPSLPLREGSDASYRFFRWQPEPLALENVCQGSPQWTVPSAASGGSRITLLGYRWSGAAEPGGSIDWTTVWQVEGQPPDDVDLHWFNHLVDGEGTRWGQKDGPGLPVSKWGDGDTVLTWFTIPIAADAPAPPYFIRTGLYTYPDVVNVPVISPPEAAPAQFVELGPIDAMP